MSNVPVRHGWVSEPSRASRLGTGTQAELERSLQRVGVGIGIGIAPLPPVLL